jgi:hypothetical protein
MGAMNEMLKTGPAMLPLDLVVIEKTGQSASLMH